MIKLSQKHKGEFHQFFNFKVRDKFLFTKISNGNGLLQLTLQLHLYNYTALLNEEKFMAQMFYDIHISNIPNIAPSCVD